MRILASLTVAFAALLAFPSLASAHEVVHDFRDSPGPVVAVGHEHVDVMRGSDFADELRGAAGPDRLLGRGGDDRLWGSRGADVLFGGSGDDRLSGGRGNDQIFCGAGRDTVIFGSGDDTFEGCEVFVDPNAPPPPPPPAACDDAADNDGDGMVDLADPGCDDASDDDEFNEPPPPPANECRVSNRDSWGMAGEGCDVGTVLMVTDGQFVCDRPLAELGPLPVKVIHTYTMLVNSGDQGGMDLLSGCRGDSDSDTIDLIYVSNADGDALGSCGGGGKFRTAPGPRDLQITGNFDGGRVCGAAHQDGIQMHPENTDANIDVVNSTSGDWDAGTATVIGAGGAFFYSSFYDADVYGSFFVTCNHGYFGHTSPTNQVVDSGFRTGAENSTCDGRSTSDPCVGPADYRNVVCERRIDGAWVSRPPRASLNARDLRQLARLS